MGSILQDMMGMASRKDTVTPKADDLLTLARYPNPQEKLKPRPSLRTELITMAKLKTFINEGDGGGLVKSLTTTGTSGVSTLVSGVLNVPSYANSIEYVNSAAFDGATDLLTLNRVSGDSIQIDMNRKDVNEYVNLTLIEASTAAPVQLPVAAQGQLFIVASAGVGANATVNLPNASATAWVFRKITVTTNGTTSASRTLTLNAAGSEEINGAGTLVLNKLYASVTLWSDGTNWIILSSSQVTVV
tara:strand:- start:2337 stop:3071 length:735 start_codon:yes stop_codon:yes gene_type:complete